MKRVLLTIAYDGTNYHGWQIQKNAVTVQQVLCEALEKMLGKTFDVTGTSRTDAGVHAREFTCHIDCDDNIPEKAFVRGLNSFLPPDIAVKDCIEVANDFHARYNAKGKTYKYYIYNSNEKDPFKMRYSWQIERKLDVKLMNEFASKLIGTHDFYAFSSAGRTVEDTVRTISECYVTKENDDIVLTVSANGFLYNMVRIIAGTLLEVGKGKIEPISMVKILNALDRQAAGPTAPAHGLTLVKYEFLENGLL